MAAWQELEEPALKTIEAECEAAYETYKACLLYTSDAADE